MEFSAAIRVIVTDLRLFPILEFLGLVDADTVDVSKVPDSVRRYVGDKRFLIELDGQPDTDEPVNVLVTLDPDDHTIWADAVAVSAASVVVLPDGLPWLEEAIRSHVVYKIALAEVESLTA